ncbi:hypothetical protein IW140_002472 [Coemansia sp. RSA 1813]|nr:hypothetical protein EV178_001955 [Coemansia sp. RSA 1646]KAJ1768898.1 hypothetical protein LPJ74_004498 [Coemansia sp. RSA 1843]KAJ2091050.1 hypothetical protein IW138_002244 [Coemansia sp. RSA 986]KAJ2215959.1 hypothetical protein EV179_001787 [Coemansia sp. RSA 487]KAJ2570196.1 hypothetical protein IW140_002472 [Coemansia sp. RSA 1813]
MVHSSRSILPKWYNEVKFLESEAISATSDTTHSFIFGRMYKTPSNRTYRDGNHLRINFCHLEFPYDCNGCCLAEPPDNIAQTVSTMYKASWQNQPPEDGGVKEGSVLARCVVDYTVQRDSKLVSAIVEQFDSAGYKCERGLEDIAMCLKVTEDAVRSARSRISSVCPSVAIRRITDYSVLDPLAECNAKAFGYDAMGDTAWLRTKLARQISQPKVFSVYAAMDNTPGSGSKVLAFAVIYRPAEKVPDLAFVQVVGTAPKHRRRGLASAVLQHALEQLPAGTLVYLEAFERHAIALYKNIGFKEVGKLYSTECMLLK